MKEKLLEKAKADVKQICKNIKNIRLSKDFRQEKVADLIGIDTSTYNKIENGRLKLTAIQIAVLANVFSVSIVELLIWPQKLAIAKQEKIEPRVTLQIELSEQKKDQVLNLVFGENNIEILNK